MAKFKVGDRVRAVNESRGWGRVSKGDCGVVASGPDEQNDYLVDFPTQNGWWGNERVLELITDYQPITPKVGEKYRVLKKTDPCHLVTVGETIEVIGKDYQFNAKTSLSSSFGLTGYLTTEYLELVEKPKRTISVPDGFFTPFDMSEAMRNIAEYSAQHYTNAQPIKQTLIQKTMNIFKKAMLDADTKTLIKAGFLDDESLTLTGRGDEALDFILFEKHKAELVAAAEAHIAEDEAKCKQ